jgi:hypothetical protein
MKVFFGVLGVLLATLTILEAQSPDPVAQCQAQVRLGEDAERYARSIAVQLLVRVEKAEAEVRELQKHIDSMKKVTPEENNGSRP